MLCKSCRLAARAGPRGSTIPARAVIANSSSNVRAQRFLSLSRVSAPSPFSRRGISFLDSAPASGRACLSTRSFVERRGYSTASDAEHVGAASTEEDVQVSSSWDGLAVSPTLVRSISPNYPYIARPTPAQRLFLLAVGAGKEVFLKDEMGRGKTFALALAALNLALSQPPGPSPSPRIMILVPTPYLAHQIYDHLHRLSSPPPSSTEEEPKSLFTLLRPRRTSSDIVATHASAGLSLPDTPIILSSAKDLEQYDISTLTSLEYIFVDEPDTLLGPLPPRHYPAQLMASHPLYRHPPPIVGILNRLLNIHSNRRGETDFSQRRDEINTVWTSATMGKEFKRVVKTRGWIRRGKGVVDLDFTSGASDKARVFRERLLEAMPPPEIASGARDDVDQSDLSAGAGVSIAIDSIEGSSVIRHYALVVSPEDGTILALVPGSTYLPPVVNGPPETPESPQGFVSPLLLEALALLHATSPPPLGQYALALPPEGVSLSTLSSELSKLGIPSLVLAPHLLQLDLKATLEELVKEGSSAPEEDAEGDDHGEPEPAGERVAPILLVHRSSVPGLHLQDLHTIYLLNGLDVKGLSQKQRKSGGVKDRSSFYDLVTGRLGRLGTGVSLPSTSLHPTLSEKPNTDVESEGEERQVATESRAAGHADQRVISIVMGGSEEERRLGDMFLASGGEDESVERHERTLDAYDLEGMYAALEREVGESGDEGGEEEAKD